MGVLRRRLCFFRKMKIMMRIKTFGKLTEITGSSELVLEDVQDTVALKSALVQHFPALAGLKFFIAVDNKMTRSNTPIGKDAEIALLPPFSGG